jgi:chitinase
MWTLLKSKPAAMIATEGIRWLNATRTAAIGLLSVIVGAVAGYADTISYTQPDPASENTYKQLGFNPATSTDVLNRTSHRVGVPLFNRYNTDPQRGQVSGYISDWAQYDNRLQKPGGDPSEAGEGYDLTKLDPFAYDVLILGFLGITGEEGALAEVVKSAADALGRKQDEIVPVDPWGDLASYENVGFNQWISNDYASLFYQSKAQGMFGGLRLLKEKNPALKLAFSIGGWTMSGRFSGIAADPIRRAVFINSVVDMFVRFPMFDMVDIDWEYPGGGGLPGNEISANDGKNYAQLIKELKGALDNAFGLDKKQIGIAMSADIAKIDRAGAKDLVDAGVSRINLMTYDFFGTGWSSNLAHHTALYKSADGEFSADAAVSHLIDDLKINPKVIHLGYAGYSRNGAGATITSISPLKGTFDTQKLNVLGTFEVGNSNWYDIIFNYLDLDRGAGKNGYKLYTDTVANADYLFNPVSKVFISLETPRTTKVKGQYAAQRGLGGLFTWTVDGDTGILANAAREGLGYSVVAPANVNMQPLYFSGESGS